LHEMERGTMKRQTLTVEEAAQVLGLAKPTVYAAVKRGELPVVRIGDRVLIPRSALQRMLCQAARPSSTSKGEGVD
jgi:excisionase family DNA binding protein